MSADDELQRLKESLKRRMEGGSDMVEEESVVDENLELAKRYGLDKDEESLIEEKKDIELESITPGVDEDSVENKVEPILSKQTSEVTNSEKKRKKKKKDKKKPIETEDSNADSAFEESDENLDEDKKNKKDDTVVDAELKDMLAQAELIAAEENKLSERVVYYSEYLLKDLEVIYGNIRTLGDEWKQTQSRLNQFGIRWVLDPVKREVKGVMKSVRDMAKGKILLDGIKSYFDLKDGEPENWNEVSALAKASVIDLDDLEKARKVVDRGISHEEPDVEEKLDVSEASIVEIPVAVEIKKKKLIWYKDIGVHLRWVVSGDNKEKKEIALKRLVEEKVPVEKLKVNKEDGLPTEERRLLRAKVFWASKILEGQDIFDENKKRINPWPSRDEALGFLEELLDIGIPESEQKKEEGGSLIGVEKEKAVPEVEQKLSEKSYEFGNKTITCRMEENVQIVDYAGIKGDLLLASSEKFRTNTSFAAVDKRLRDHGIKWELGISVVTKGS